MPDTAPLISGLLLAGGRGHRMGGRNKGLLPLAGRPLAAPAVALLQAHCAEVLISANEALECWEEQFRLPVLQDRIPGSLGPLAGLHTGLLAATHPLLLCLPCDTPFLPGELGGALLQALITSNADIAIARSSQHTHPLCCLCRHTLADDLAEYLQLGGRKVGAWQARHHTVEVLFADEEAFRNINTPAELAAAEAVLLASRQAR